MSTAEGRTQDTATQLAARLLQATTLHSHEHHARALARLLGVTVDEIELAFEATWDAGGGHGWTGTQECAEELVVRARHQGRLPGARERVGRQVGPVTFLSPRRAMGPAAAWAGPLGGAQVIRPAPGHFQGAA